MSDHIDTTPDAVRRLVDDLKHAMPESIAEIRGHAHRTLEALLAERDDLRASRKQWIDECDRLRAGGCARDQRTTQYCAIAVDAQSQRDDLRARLERAENRNELLTDHYECKMSNSERATRLEQQLTSAQAREARLREAAEEYMICDTQENRKALRAALAQSQEQKGQP